MSNGRKWRRGRVGAAAAAGLGMAVAPMALIGGTASAAPTAFTAAATNPVTVARGTTSTGSPTFTLTIPASSFVPGDVIAIDSPDVAATTNAQAVDFAGTPTVTATSTGGTAPTFTASLGHNAAATGSTGTDEIDLTETAAPGTSTAPVTVTVTGATVAAGASAPLAAQNATATYKTLGATAVTEAVAGPFAYVTNVTVGAGTPVLLPQTGAGPVPNITIAEASPGVLGQSVTVTLGGTAGATFASQPTVTSSNSAATVTPGTNPTGQATYTFTILPTTAATGPTTLTISGITVNEATRSAGSKVTAAITTTPTGGAVAPIGSAVPLGANATAATIAGVDAQTTAADIYNASTVTTSTLVLATDYNFPDALSGAYLAGGGRNLGIALSDQTALPPATQQIILKNKPSTIYVLGGPVAISPAVITQIQSLYPANTPAQPNNQPNIVRLGGADQFGTNQLIVDQVPYSPTAVTLPSNSGTTYNDTTGASSSTFPTTGQKTAIVASGVNFPDALSASPLAYKDGIPIILTTPDTLSSTASALLGSLGINQVIMVGGPAAISDAVEGQISGATGLNIPVLRVAGQDATDTAQKLGALDVANFGFANLTTYVARGDFYTDALAAAPYLAEQNTPIELTETPTVVGPYLPAYLASQGAASHNTLTQFGGPAAITPATQNSLLSDIAAGTTAP